ncbi:hypothetical protein M413DRAFT_158811 [Hebeloma cylindrosporum]|uniref:Uncharacterized protein n=1 Tax=Hebeloma cylindrosporum TaxID=76867 RepID=A0A0C3CA10_HEBCY|nr:hypothetical protein M413DRAFT_158811 [Hebeloma cylindrosporum h7]
MSHGRAFLGQQTSYRLHVVYLLTSTLIILVPRIHGPRLLSHITSGRTFFLFPTHPHLLAPALRLPTPHHVISYLSAGRGGLEMGGSSALSIVLRPVEQPTSCRLLCAPHKTPGKYILFHLRTTMPPATRLSNHDACDATASNMGNNFRRARGAVEHLRRFEIFSPCIHSDRTRFH